MKDSKAGAGKQFSRMDGYLSSIRQSQPCRLSNDKIGPWIYFSEMAELVLIVSQNTLMVLVILLQKSASPYNIQPGP